MCAGGTFLKNTGSKSNTLIASSGFPMSAASASSCSSLEGRSTPASASTGEAASGLAESHLRSRRRFANCRSDDFMSPPCCIRCGIADLVCLDLRLADHLRPARHLDIEKRAELLWRPRHNVDAGLAEALADFGRCDDLH